MECAPPPPPPPPPTPECCSFSFLGKGTPGPSPVVGFEMASVAPTSTLGSFVGLATRGVTLRLGLERLLVELFWFAPKLVRTSSLIMKGLVIE